MHKLFIEKNKLKNIQENTVDAYKIYLHNKIFSNCYFNLEDEK